MPLPVHCPYCQETATLLSTVSSLSIFDYYVCDACSRLAERPKGATGPVVPLMIRTALHAPPNEPLRG
jgi:hypothetical protein